MSEPQQTRPLCPICGAALDRCNAPREGTTPPATQRALDHPAQAELDAAPDGRKER